MPPVAIGVVMVGPVEQSRAAGQASADAADVTVGRSSGVPPADGAGTEAKDGDPREVAVRALRRSLRNPFRVGFVLGGLLAVAAALLVIQNGESAQIDWLWMQFAAPLWLVLLLSMVAGALVWETIKAAVRRGRRLRRERREALQRLREGAAAAS